MKLALALLALLPLAACASPRVGDRFQTTAPITAFQDLVTYRSAMVPERRRLDEAKVAALLKTGAAFPLPTGTTGEILGLNQVKLSSESENAMAALAGNIADVRLDGTANPAVISLDKNIRLLPKQPPRPNPS